MAHWDGELFGETGLPKDIQCATCVHRLRPVKVGEFTQDRYNYAMCDKYQTKPMGVLLKKQPCTEYVKEE